MGAQLEVRAPCTESGCRKKHRTDGSHYSADPAVRMAELKAEGRIGAEFGKLGGRPRKPRAAEAVAEHARQHADRIIDALDSGLDSENERIRMEAAQAFIKIEKDEASIQLDEDEFDQMSAQEQLKQLKDLAGDPVLRALFSGKHVSEEEIDDVIEEIELVDEEEEHE
jgi:hypothetical protein